MADEPTNTNKGDDNEPKLWVKLLLLLAAIGVAVLVVMYVLPVLQKGTLGPSSLLQ